MVCTVCGSSNVADYSGQCYGCQPLRPRVTNIGPDGRIGYVEWAENPLASKVHLTDYGRLFLRYNIALDGINDAVTVIEMDRDSSNGKPSRGGTWADTYEYLPPEPLDDASPFIEGRIEHLAKRMEAELLETHYGDCTRVPCSCMKCYAEGFLKFYTTEGLGYSSGHYIQSAFGKGGDMAAALHSLRNPAKPTWGTEADWAPHQARWAANRAAAIEWLTNYGKEHGFL